MSKITENNLQKLRDCLKKEKLEAIKMTGKINNDNMLRVQFCLGMYVAFSLILDEIETLTSPTGE